jgi:microcompartment protein CcmL/EutN
MEGALGMVEIRGLAAAITVADVMAKTAAVEIIDLESARGGGWTTIKIRGNVGAVSASVSAGKEVGLSIGKFITSKVIPRPADQVTGLFCTAMQKADTPNEAPEPVKEEQETPETPEAPVKEEPETEAHAAEESQAETEAVPAPQTADETIAVTETVTEAVLLVSQPVQQSAHKAGKKRAKSR